MSTCKLLTNVEGTTIQPSWYHVGLHSTALFKICTKQTSIRTSTSRGNYEYKDKLYTIGKAMHTFGQTLYRACANSNRSGTWIGIKAAASMQNVQLIFLLLEVSKKKRLTKHTPRHAP